ncbi:bax inhibitor 1-like [Henckelia pumila]|uniref:bax inhibitor 1-like n=1 Tax=Henckelia pumila TaxID=405737 RepID=UPI003C6DC33A
MRPEARRRRRPKGQARPFIFFPHSLIFFFFFFCSSKSTLKMRAITAVRNYFRREWRIMDVVNGRDRPFVRRILKKVYLSLVFALSSLAFGSYMSCSRNIGSLSVIVGACITMICLYFVRPWHERKRVCLLIAGSFFLGASIGPSLIDPCCLVSGLLGMSMAFACFWASSMRTQSFFLLCFVGMCLSILGIPVGLLAGSAIPGCYLPFWTSFSLYVATLYFLLYVIAYSHELVINIRRGDADYVKHSVTLFTDAPPVLIHYLKTAVCLSIFSSASISSA